MKNRIFYTLAVLGFLIGGGCSRSATAPVPRTATYTTTADTSTASTQADTTGRGGPIIGGGS